MSSGGCLLCDLLLPLLFLVALGLIAKDAVLQSSAGLSLVRPSRVFVEYSMLGWRSLLSCLALLSGISLFPHKAVW